MVLALKIVPQERGRLAHVHHQHVNVAVIVEIAEGSPAARHFRRYTWARHGAHVLKNSFAQVSVYQPRVTEGLAPAARVQFRIDVAVYLEDIFPPVIVQIH